MKRLTNKEVYTIETEKGLFRVIPTRLKNDINGNPRFEFEVFEVSGEYNAVYVYRCKGHYLNTLGECKEIVNHHINELKREEVIK